MDLNTVIANYQTHLTSFAASIQRDIDADYAKNYPNLTPPTITVEHGKVYSKVWSNGNQKCIVAFVKIASGEIFKPATWRAPAKHARGNIFNADNGRGAMDAKGYFVRYL